MKRWLLCVLIGVVLITATLFTLHQYMAMFPALPAPQSGLTRTADSAFKYNLCTEAFAFAHASPDNPFKTDYTFHDPFRAASDTIIPYLLAYNPLTRTANFNVDIMISRVATFHASIGLVHELDGISVLLPDKQNRLQSSSVPQFIVSSLGQGRIAVLDYTCPDQWVWKLKQVTPT
ncbi:MAG: hypothetical protein JO215_06185 [Ktedonobacteraceae bacterium]|nr:hypothetical protein [Ktedonobacteraceae bacterium]